VFEWSSGSSGEVRLSYNKAPPSRQKGTQVRWLGFVFIFSAATYKKTGSHWQWILMGCNGGTMGHNGL
jgi:hypothetical protein